MRSNSSPIFSSTAIEAALSGAVMATIRRSPSCRRAYASTAAADSDGISLRPVTREKRKAHVDVGESVALHQTANADGRAAVSRQVVQSETESPIAVDRPLAQMYSRASDSVLTPLSPMKRKNAVLIQQSQDEFVVLQFELAQLEPRGPDDDGALHGWTS